MGKIKLKEEAIAEQIYFIRGEKVMLDFDLALLYQVETRSLKQAVRRNKDSFPSDFMFSLTKKEWNELITNCDNLQNRKFSPALPFVFTEQGVAMLSSVLKSKRARLVNIAIMRTFVQMRRFLETHKALASQLDKLENKVDKHDQAINAIFEAIRQLMQPGNNTRKQIGYKRSNEK